MALWGKADSLYSVGTIQVNYATKQIIGSGTSFTAAGISTGDVITVGSGGIFGSAVISGISSDTVISIATTQYLTGQVISGESYSISERPIYTLEDSNYSSNVVGLTSTIPTHGILGVDEYEMEALSSNTNDSGISTQYGGFHAGWVGIHTYVDAHGYLRVKSETLVAMSGISTLGSASFTAAGDADDDTILPDRTITVTISASPSAVVGVGTTVVLTANASANPSASLSYDWVKNGSTTGVTTPTISIGNTNTANNGSSYYVRVTASGGASAKSNTIKLSVS